MSKCPHCNSEIDFSASMSTCPVCEKGLQTLYEKTKNSGGGDDTFKIIFYIGLGCAAIGGGIYLYNCWDSFYTLRGFLISCAIGFFIPFGAFFGSAEKR